DESSSTTAAPTSAAATTSGGGATTTEGGSTATTSGGSATTSGRTGSTPAASTPGGGGSDIDPGSKEPAPAGVGLVDGVYKGTGDFELDPADCPEDWDPKQGITDTEIRLFQSLPTSGPLAGFG